MLKNKMKTSLFLAVTAVCFCLTGCGEEQEQAVLETTMLAPEKVNYNTIEAQLDEYVMTSTGSVSMEFPTPVDLCWETSGTTMKEILVERGQEVKAGDVLMTFEIESDKIKLEEMELQLLRKKEDYTRKKDAQEVELEKARTKAEEIENSYSYRVAVLNVEKQQIAYERYVYETEKAIAALEEQIAEYKELISNNKLVAPFDGMIGSISYASEGDDVVVGERLISMYRTDEILLKVKNADGKLRYNMDVTIKMPNQTSGKVYAGHVISAPNILPSSVNQDYALIALDEELPMRMMMFGMGGFEFEAEYQRLEDVLLIDKKAINKEEGKDYVYILEDGAVHKRFVTTGMSTKSVAWILDGLSEGQQVIVN